MDALTPQLIDFIAEQPMLRVAAPDRIRWLNLTGSGNETAAHVAAAGRMTLMFSSFTKMPLTLRLYGTAAVVHPRDENWADVVGDFPDLAGSRQVFDLAIEEVATSIDGLPTHIF